MVLTITKQMIHIMLLKLLPNRQLPTQSNSVKFRYMPKDVYKRQILLTVTGLAVAQTSTNSPYTRYGFGQLADQNFGNSKAMGGKMCIRDRLYPYSLFLTDG